MSIWPCDVDGGPYKINKKGFIVMDEVEIAKIRFMLDRQDEAYKYTPTGSWFQRWIPLVCKHERIRCTHADEIIHRRFRRRICMICGRSLKGPLPKICFFTGTEH